MNALPSARRFAFASSCAPVATSTYWKITWPWPNSSFSTLRSIHPGNARVTGGEPWIAVTPPTAALTSANRSAAAGAAIPSACAGFETSGPYDAARGH